MKFKKGIDVLDVVDQEVILESSKFAEFVLEN